MNFYNRGKIQKEKENKPTNNNTTHCFTIVWLKKDIQLLIFISIHKSSNDYKNINKRDDSTKTITPITIQESY